MRERRVYAGSAGQFNERRNTSRVFAPDFDAYSPALAASQRWQADNPAHARWIADGCPTLTADEHVERFGVAYVPPQHRKRPK